MEAVRKKVESQVQFWSLLGPFLVLLSIAVLLFKVSIHWYYPVSALIGIPLCVKWKMKGMAIALCSLLLLSGIGYQSLELDDRYWHVGLALAMAFSFIILTLSLEEVQGLVAKLQLESKSRLDNFVILDERMKASEQEWATEKEQFKTEASAFNLEIARVQEEKQTYFKLAQLSKDEIVIIRGQHEQVLQELLYKKQQIAQLHERLEETELSLQAFVNSDSEKQILALSDQLEILEKDKEVLAAKVAVAQSDAKACQEEKEHFSQALKKCQESHASYLNESEKSRQEQEKLELEHEALQHKLSLIIEERNALSQANAGKLSIQEHQNQLLAQKEKFERQIKENDEQQAEESRQKLKAAAEEINRLELHYQKAQQDLQAALETVEFQNQELRHLQLKEEQGKSNLEALISQFKEQNENFERQIKENDEKHAEESRQKLKTVEEEINLLELRYQKAQHDLQAALETVEFQNQELRQFQQKEEQGKANLDALVSQLNEQSEKFERQIKENNEKQAEESRQKLKAVEDEINLFELRHQKAQQDLQAADETVEFLNQELRHLQQKEEQSRKDLDALLSQLKEQRDQFEIECQKNQDLSSQHWQQEQQTLQQEIKSVQDCNQQTQEELLKVKSELDSKNIALNQLEAQISQLTADLAEKQTAADKAGEHVQNVENLKHQLEQLLGQTQAELQTAQQKLESSLQKREKLPREKLPYAPGNTRHIEAMYIQLKGQFLDKCAVLDETRRSLFHANEELLKHQKECEEEKIFGESATEKLLQRNLLQLSRHYDQLEKNTQQEIEELHQLVQELLQQKKLS